GRVGDRLECLGLRLAGAEEEILWRELRRYVAKNSIDTVDALGLLPSGAVAVHDAFMGFPHVLADELLGMRQPSDDVPQAVGNQDRLRCRQSAFLEML